jgi:hypothetical protein
LASGNDDTANLNSENGSRENRSVVLDFDGTFTESDRLERIAREFGARREHGQRRPRRPQAGSHPEELRQGVRGPELRFNAWRMDSAWLNSGAAEGDSRRPRPFRARDRPRPAHPGTKPIKGTCGCRRGRAGRLAGEAAGTLSLRNSRALRQTLAANVTVFELAKVMGTSVRMIERHYGALLDGAQAGIAGPLDALEAELQRAAGATIQTS